MRRIRLSLKTQTDHSKEIQLSDTDAPMPDNSGIADQSTLEIEDLAGDVDYKTGTPLSGSGDSISGDMQFSDTDAPMPDAPDSTVIKNTDRSPS